MKLNLVLRTLLLLTVFFGINSCKKTPGQGGNAQITGKVWAEDWDDPFFTYIIHEYPASNENVYLFFGDDTSPGESVSTNANGEFQFKWLRKGKYRVVVYSKVKQDPSVVNSPKQEAIEVIINIDKKRDIKDAGTLTIKN